MSSIEICIECEMAITWDRNIRDWVSEDERSCGQAGVSIDPGYQQHSPR